MSMASHDWFKSRAEGFRVPAAIHMHFHVDVQRQPPQIHSLPKHYLDLLQTDLPSRLPQFRKLLLQDDRLVKVLLCDYTFAEYDVPPFVSFELRTLTDFARELQFYQKVVRGDFDHVDKISTLNIRDRGKNDESRPLYRFINGKPT